MLYRRGKKSKDVYLVTKVGAIVHLGIQQNYDPLEVQNKGERMCLEEEKTKRTRTRE